MPLRLVLMGTGAFALPVFRALHDSRHAVTGLFTQPDRTGRGHHRHVNPLKELALERGTPVFQPESVNAPDAVELLRDLQADLGVVAAYGQVLKPAVIDAPRLGCINVHASLLPRHRGAAPVLYAVLNGDAETGVTIFQIEPKLDAGLMYGSVKTVIGPKETTGDLQERLAELAVPLTLRIIDDLEAGAARPIPQDPQQVTRAPSLQKSAGLIDWSNSAQQIANHVRAMQPWPTPFTFLEQQGRMPLRVILIDVQPCDIPTPATAATPGALLIAERDRLVVQTGAGGLEILKLRPEGKREMTAAEFQNGHALHPGDRFVAG
ncbi:MAG: methionyl-tRNA formyltransferase [Planctomycetaceae bacterium]